MNKAVYIKADGTEQVEEHRPSLEQAQKFIGGYVEIAHVLGDENERCQMLVNECGHIVAPHLPFNAKATNYYANTHAARWSGHTIVGDVIMLYGKCKWR